MATGMVMRVAVKLRVSSNVAVVSPPDVHPLVWTSAAETGTDQEQ